MRIVITGATGFIGRALCRELSGDYEVVALSRDSRRATEVLGPGVRVVEWDGRTTSGWAGEVAGAQAVINLAGERSEEHTSELQSHSDLVCRLLLEGEAGRASCRERV